MYIDENNAADVFAPLREANVAPPRVDLEAAIGIARLRRRKHRLAGASGVAVAVAAIAIVLPLGINATRHGTPPVASATSDPVSPPATTAPARIPSPAPTSLTCTEKLLPVPDGVTMALVGGGDPTGRYLIGRSYPKGQRPQPVIWVGGVAHKVPLPGDDPDLSAVSSNGTVVGLSFAGQTMVGYIYRDGVVSRLKGTNVAPGAVNNAGVVIGQQDGGVAIPLVWHTPNSSPEKLPLPGPKWLGYATAVLDDGTMIGTVRPTAAGAEQTIIWQPDGAFRLLPVPTSLHVPHTVGFSSASVRGNIISGNVVVNKPTVTTDAQASYDLATGTYSLDPQPPRFAATGSNGHWMVGFTLPQETARPALWTPGTGIVKLPTLTKKADMDAPAFISDSGDLLAGQDTDKHGVIRAVEWRCH